MRAKRILTSQTFQSGATSAGPYVYKPKRIIITQAYFLQIHRRDVGDATATSNE